MPPPTKHQFFLTANYHVIEEWPFTPPEFCVGERVLLETTLQPPVPGILKPDYSHWGIDGSFINKIVPADGQKSPQYLMDPSLLLTPGKFQPAVTNWWYDQGNPSVACTWKFLRFSNGQMVDTLGIARKVRIYRPTLTNPITFASPRSFLVVGGLYAYGDDNANRLQLAWTNAIVNSDYDGEIAVTQLIEGMFTTWSIYGVPDDDLDTDGQYWLDTEEYYVKRTFRVATPSSATFDFLNAP